MNSMFYGCAALNSLSLPSWDTSQVTTMSSMFYGCVNLTNLTIPGWNVGLVTNMQNMFRDCSALAQLDVSEWNIGSPASMRSMFQGCSSLTMLNLSGWNTGAVTDMQSMFNGCSALVTIYVTDEWNTANVTAESSSMFVNANSLIGGQGTAFNSAHIDISYAHIDGGPDAPGYLTAVPSDCTLISGNEFRQKLNSSVTEIVFGQKTAYQDTVRGRAGKPVDIDGQGLIELYMVPNAGGTAYTAYVLSRGSICANADSSGMFQKYTRIKTIDFSNFDTGSTTNMREMFSGCTGLTNLDVSNWNTENVTDLRGMFYGCTRLTNLDASSWNTKNVEDIQSMFYNCTVLESVNVSGWNTENVKSMQGMFYSCKALVTIDISGWSSSRQPAMGNMFYGCSALTTIYADNSWDGDAAASSNSQTVFSGCKNLVGGKGTEYVSSRHSGIYAHIDGGESAPGYFTAKE